LFLAWFISGIAMIYARGMPALTPETRFERLPALNTASIRLTPAQAAAKSELGPPGSAELLTILKRPAYRFDGITVFADDGELFEVTPESAAEAAQLFSDLPEDQVRPAGVLMKVDQWTIGKNPHLPIYKFAVDDGEGTELYVSGILGEVIVMTTRSSRRLAWVAAIPHWFYFESLRTRPQLWRQTILWTSGLGTMAALIGLILAFIQYRRRPPHIPYKGWLRWHYITGAIFGVFTVTWVFSGFLSVEPWYWASDGAIGGAQAAALQGGELDLQKFPTGLPQLPETSGAKEVEYLTIQGEAYYRVRTNTDASTLISAPALQVRSEPFSVESLMERVLAANPELQVLESALLEDYDSYYYAFERRAPLPVLRIKFDDPESTWLYVDPQMSQLVGRAHRRERLQRWIYHGFHSLDFSFWYYNRPVWDIGVIVLSLGGTLLSVIGIVIAWKRLFRVKS
jgi:hypothetical protein